MRENFVVSIAKIEAIQNDGMEFSIRNNSFFSKFLPDNTIRKQPTEITFINKMEAVYEILTNRIYVIYNDTDKKLIDDENITIDKISDLFKAYYKKASTINRTFFNNQFTIIFESLKSNHNKKYQDFEKIILISSKNEKAILEKTLKTQPKGRKKRYNDTGDTDEELILGVFNEGEQDD